MDSGKVKIRLQGHEKFGLREGWINKGLQIVRDRQDAFVRKDAPDVFGVGSNMVKSIRYWMKAFGLTNDNGSALSDLGETILQYDPYLEQYFTLWLLHSFIAKNKEEATTWYMYFSRCDASDLDKEQILSVLNREIAKYTGGQSFSVKSLENDIDVLLNMYSKNKEKNDPEDKNTSPFSSLGLVKKSEGRYSKHSPDRKTLNEMVVLYELADMCTDRDSISIEEVLDGECGLVKIYNISSITANEMLDKLDTAGYIKVDRTAGLDMIYMLKKLDKKEIVENYYKHNKGKKA